MNILIGSIGRRVYLIDWFEDAMARAGVDVQVHVTDADAHSGGMLYSQHPHVVPPYSASDCEEAFHALAKELESAIVLSVNDYELDRMAEPSFRAELHKHSQYVLGLCRQAQNAVSDKLLMATQLARSGISTSETIVASDEKGLQSLAELQPTLVVKDRFGSGSSGFRVVGAAELRNG